MRMRTLRRGYTGRPLRRVGGPAYVVLAALVVLLASCWSGRVSGNAHRSIRGVRLESFSCSASATSARKLMLQPNSVTAFLLCPVVPPSAQTRTSAIEVTAGRSFRRLVTTLSAPNETPSTRPCAAVALAPQKVVAQTRSGPVLVTIPVDGCGFYQRAVLEALNRARSR